MGEPATWNILGEQLMDDSRRARVSIASVELPDGVRFEQWVMRLPSAAIVVVLNNEDQVLMLWRHRFVIDSWVWELPGGYLDDDEGLTSAAVREVEEETGWTLTSIRELIRFQPMVGGADALNVVFIAKAGQPLGTGLDINEAVELRWIPLADIPQMITDRQIIGSASIIGLQQVLLGAHPDDPKRTHL